MTAIRSLVANPDEVVTRYLRGAELAAHVTRGLATTATARQIAQGAGYRVDRCAQRLAEAHHAPLARILLARDWNDQQTVQEAVRVDAEWEAWKAQADRVRIRPPMTRDELLDELTDMAAVGLTFGEVSERFGVSPDCLRRRIRARNLRAEAHALFPDRFKITSRDVAA